MSNYGLENLSDAATGAALAMPSYKAVEARNNDGSIITINQATRIIDLDAYADGKRRKTGVFTTCSVADFVRFIKDESTPEHCKIFVDDEAMKAKAFLNYGQDGFEQGKLDYTASIELRKTPVFDKLVQLHHNTISQQQLIDFLTDYAPLLHPINAQEDDISIGNAINSLRQVTIDETKNSTNEVQNFGETRSTFEKVQARAANDTMPVMFHISDACYQSLSKTDITMRLVIHAKDGKPYFKLMINAIDLLQLERAETFVGLINDGLAGEFDVMLGSFKA